jgi:hypothetical protein
MRASFLVRELCLNTKMICIRCGTVTYPYHILMSHILAHALVTCPCHMVLSHAPVTCSCHMLLSHAPSHALSMPLSHAIITCQVPLTKNWLDSCIDLDSCIKMDNWSLPRQPNSKLQAFNPTTQHS